MPEEYGGKVSTANKRTYPAMATNGCLATYGRVKKWDSVLDLFSDVLSARNGQKVFFNITRNDPLGRTGRSYNLDEKSEELEPENFLEFCGGSSQRGKYGFAGIFEIAGKPRFHPEKVSAKGMSDSNAVLEPEFAIRVPIRPVEVFTDTIEEWRLLDVYDSNSDIWQARFRKFLQSPKSLTSATPWEEDRMREIMEENIESAVSGEELGVEPYDDGEKISIDDRLDQDIEGRQSTMEEGGISQMSLDDIVIVEKLKTKPNRFKHEKGLEAWWAEMFDKDVEQFENLIAGEELVWFSNYVPAGSSGKALDGLAITRKDNGNLRVIPVEMKKKKVKERAGDRHVQQLYRYSIWAKEFLTRKSDSEVEEVQPVFLANKMTDSARSKAKRKLNSEEYFSDPIFLSYNIEDEEVNLNREELS